MSLQVVRTYLARLRQASEEGRLVLFVGAGVSANSGVPTWGELIEALKSELPEFAQREPDSLKVAQIYRNVYPGQTNERVRQLLQDDKVAPTVIHDALLALQPCHIITTNYDTLLEQALAAHKAPFSTISRDQDLTVAREKFLLIKMHGDFSADNIVLSEQDYYDYERNFPLIRAFVLSLLASKVVLFVGFSFNDLNLKIILRELQSVLQQRMQPVYMLTDEVLTHEQRRYLEDKGLVPVCMDQEVVEQIDNTQPIHIDVPSTLTDLHGKNLYKQLSLIRNYCPTSDLFDALLSASRLYADEIGYYGLFLGNVLPKDLRGDWHQYGPEVTLRQSPYAALMERVKNKDKAVIGSESYNKFRKLAIANDIFYINGQYLYTDSDKAEKKEAQEGEALDSLFDFNMREFQERINKIVGAPFSGTQADLELPHILYWLGRREEAFRMFSQLATRYWDTHKYILYLICRINLYVLARQLEWDGSDDAWLKNERKKILDTSLDALVNQTPLPDGLRRMFSEVVSFRFFLRKESETAKTAREIEEQRQAAERGGGSLNHYHYVLAHSFLFLARFGIGNHLLIEAFSPVANIYKDIAKGYIDSLNVKGGQEQNTHITDFNVQDLLLFIFYLPHVALKDILERNEKASLPMADDAKEYIQTVLKNLTEASKQEASDLSSLLESTHIGNALKNFCLLLTYLSDETLPYTDIYKVILCQLHGRNVSEYASILQRLLDKQQPSAKEAAQLLSMYLEYHNSGDIPRPFIAPLAHIAAEGRENIKLPHAEDWPADDLIILAEAHEAFTPAQQNSVDALVRQRVNTLDTALMIELGTDCHILDEVLFDSLCAKIPATDIGNHRSNACYWLYILYHAAGHEAYRTKVEALIPKQPCLAFLLNPCANIDHAEAKWIPRLQNDQLIELIHSPEAMKRVDELCNDPDTSAGIRDAIKDNIWSALIKIARNT